MQVILSLFPGADLFGRAFEELGFCVVRGPDILWGGDIRNFHAPPGRFDGIIGGPPCQCFSRAGVVHNHGVNLIPEFVRVVEEAKPKWAIMENVVEALPYAPDWPHVKLRDWDCGGYTHRTRLFWFYGIEPPPPPPKREGKPELSVVASAWKNRSGTKRKNLRLTITPEEAARLQGFPGLHAAIMDNQPQAVSQASRRCLAIHMLGNGVPRAMGLYLAKWVKHVTEGEEFSVSML